VEARELKRGNSREALERLKQRRYALLGRIRSSLADATEQADAQQGMREAGWSNLHRLCQLRAQLEDGFCSYGQRLDRPLHRMLRCQLRRAADQERRLLHSLRQEPRGTALITQLEVLAESLEIVLDQWLPLDASAMASSEAEPSAQAARAFARMEPANAIRPAVVVPFRREGA